MNATEANPSTARPRRLFPGPIASPIIALCLLVIMGVRLVGYTENQPYLLDDPAIRNLVALIAAFIACITLWTWFGFFSDHPRLARRVAMFTAAGAVVCIGIVIASMGLTKTIQFSGSMVPRLASAEAEFEPIRPRESTASVDLATTTPDDFPQFLGPERSCWIPRQELARDWSAAPPKLVWKRPIGAGWSAFAAVNGYAVTMEQRGEEEWVVCYEIATGEPVWGHSIQARHENPLGGIGPRSTPTIHQGRVYALGATGVLRCFDGATGKLIWSDDLRKRYGVTDVEDEANVMWGRSASPLIVDQLVVVPGGGPSGKAKNLVAFEAASGKVVWEAESQLDDGSADQMGYASPALAQVAGEWQILIVNEKTASGHNPQTGERRWSHPWPSNSNGDACSSQAVAIGDNQVLLSKGYSAGAELIEIVPQTMGRGLEAKSVWRLPRVLQTKFTNVVVKGGHAFGLSEGILECVDVATGKRKWKNGRYEHGQILGVGELLLVLSEEGELHLVELNPAKFIHLSSHQALEGKTWNNLCLYGKRLLIRNAQEAACYELP